MSIPMPIPMPLPTLPDSTRIILLCHSPTVRISATSRTMAGSESGIHSERKLSGKPGFLTLLRGFGGRQNGIVNFVVN